MVAPTWVRSWLVCILGVVSLASSLPAADPAPPSAAPAAAEPMSEDGALDSPRAAMRAFLQGMADLKLSSHDEKAWINVKRTLDTHSLPADVPLAAQRAARDLLAVLDKLGTVVFEELPSQDVVQFTGMGRYVYFPGKPEHAFVWEELKAFNRWPQGSIVLEETAPGRWQFSAETVAGIAALHASMEPLPPRHLAPPPKPDEVGRLMSVLGPTFQRTEPLHWMALLAAIFLGLLAGKIVQSSLRGTGQRLMNRGALVRGTVLHDAAGPVNLALITLGLGVGLSFIWLEELVAGISAKAVLFLYMFALGWFAFNLVDLVDLALRRITAASASTLDDMIVPLVRKTLRIFMIIVFGILVLQNVFELNITGFLASLGIAGLAISLAAQDSVKNLFGSLTVFFDKPFAVGQRIKFDTFDGIVEEIGFRSTRIRTLEGHLVTVPNMVFIDKTVENVAMRPSIRRILDVTITYDTPPEKIRQALQIIKDILAEPAFAEPFDMVLSPPRVAFDNFNADSLNIKVIYWYLLSDGRDYWGYLDHTERFNLRLFEAFNQAGIEFAFPTQTLYLAGDKARPLSVAVNASDPRGPEAKQVRG